MPCRTLLGKRHNGVRRMAPSRAFWRILTWRGGPATTAKPLVAATDGSEESLRAVEWAAREAVLRGTPLRIVTAVSLPRMLELQVRPDRDFVADLIHEERDRAFAAAAVRAAEVAPGLQVDTVPLADPPAQAVTGSGSGALMLVLGSRGSGAFGSMALGSVSRYAAAHASCPVLVVRGETAAVHRRVGIGVGDLDTCADSLTFAFEEASLRKASLMAIHALRTRNRHLASRGPGCHRSRRRQAARRTAGQLAEEVPRRPGQPGCRARPPGPGAGRPVRPGRPGGYRQAR